MTRRRRNPHACRCGNPDWPGQCPGPANCPVHGEDLEIEERDPDEERQSRLDDKD